MLIYTSAVESAPLKRGAQEARADLENDTEKSRSNVKKELNLRNCAKQEIRKD